MKSWKKMKLLSLLVVIWALQGFPNMTSAAMDQAGLTVVRESSSKHHNVSVSWNSPQLGTPGTENHTVLKDWILPTSPSGAVSPETHTSSGHTENRSTAAGQCTNKHQGVFSWHFPKHEMANINYLQTDTVLDQLSSVPMTLKPTPASNMHSGHTITSAGFPTDSKTTTTTGPSLRPDPSSLTPCPVLEMCSTTNPKDVENLHLIQTCGYGQRDFPPNTICYLRYTDEKAKQKTIFIKFLNLEFSEVDILKIYDGPDIHSLNTSMKTKPIRVTNGAYSIMFKSAKATGRPIQGWRALVYTELTTDAEMKQCLSNPATVSCTLQTP